MSAAFRQANLGDIDLLVQMRFAYFASENFDVSKEQRDLIENHLRNYLSNQIKKSFFASLAEMDNVIVSVAYLAVTEKPANPFFPTGKTGTILNVYTHPQHRNQGYATQLLKSLIEEARKNQVAYLELSASEMGKPLYQRLGFAEPDASRFTAMRLTLL